MTASAFLRATGRGVGLRAIYAACLLGATYNHAALLWAGGILYDYGGRPWVLCAYWTGLTLADPAAALLLFARPRWGVRATLLIIVTDVAINVVVTGFDIARYGGRPTLAYLMQIEQAAFLLFVAATARHADPPAPG